MMPSNSLPQSPGDLCAVGLVPNSLSEPETETDAGRVAGTDEHGADQERTRFARRTSKERASWLACGGSRRQRDASRSQRRGKASLHQPCRHLGLREPSY